MTTVPQLIGLTDNSSDCVSLRNAVIALSAILGTLVLALILFAVSKARRWVADGATSKDAEIELSTKD